MKYVTLHLTPAEASAVIMAMNTLEQEFGDTDTHDEHSRALGRAQRKMLAAQRSRSASGS